MLTKRTKICHKKSGVELTTPLLIPSFSSKGFSTIIDGKSEIDILFRDTSEFITDVCLVSAFDLFYSFLPPPENWKYYPTLVFLDSGGYEISPGGDYSSSKTPKQSQKEWSRGQLLTLWKHWDVEFPAVFISYDHYEDRSPVQKQVELALQMRKEATEHLHLFLLKPECSTHWLLSGSLKTIIDSPSAIKKFDIIGVTEKELGSNILNRMLNISKLRIALDDSGYNIPIHIFGALDPISVILYYIAGAEIFDGLTWIRYAYRNDLCVYPHNHLALTYGISHDEEFGKLEIMTQNLYLLENLNKKMISFDEKKDFRIFESHADFIESSIYEHEKALKERSE